MPNYMRLQKQKKNKSAASRDERVLSRLNAAKLLDHRATGDSSMSNCGMARAASVPSLVEDAMEKELKSSGSSALLLPTRKLGLRTVLTTEEEQFIVNRFMTASVRGASIGYKGLRYMMTRVADDPRACYEKELPSYGPVRAFRARHRNLTFMSHESNETRKMIAENRYHVQSVFDRNCKISEENTGM